jgi:hypothetical protein
MESISMASTFIAGKGREVKSRISRFEERELAAAVAWITELDGDPGKTRTSDTQFRKLLLYPPELRGHVYNQ